MADTYTQSFNIPSGGWSGLATALMYAGTSAATPGITAGVVLWRDANYVGNTLVNNSFTTITLLPGVILPLKIRGITHAGAAGTVTGFN